MIVVWYAVPVAGPPEFLDWPGYAPLWANLMTWLARGAGS
jgi:uncharacterized membrane protein